MPKYFKLVYNYIQFFYLFIQNLGGIKIFINKLFVIFQTTGRRGFMDKTKYILYQAKISSVTPLKQIQSNSNLYQKFISKKTDLIKLRKHISNFETLPLISVVMPTYNSNTDWLTEAIESVRKQIYTNWELCIADDASSDEKCKTLLRKYQKIDKRIKVVFRSINEHISKASNSALEIASGEYVALLDHDDKLPEDALFWVSKVINENPAVSLIYSDEDKFDLDGLRSDPYFKCDWNYSLFLSQNLINHLGVYKTRIMKKIGGFRQGYEGSQDYDLALRFIEQIPHEQIIHIPRILYHWRIHKNSTAFRSDEKPYALTSGRRAIEEHLERIGVSAGVEILDSKMYRVKYDLPQNHPLVSIIIPTKNNLKLLKKCIKSINSKTEYKNYEILIIDNNSDDLRNLRYLEKIEKSPNIRVLSDKRDFNFSAINNKAVKSVKGDYICFLNDDTEVISPKWLTEMISIGAQKGVGAVGVKLWYPNNTLQHGGVILGIGGIAGHSHKYFLESQAGYFNRANLIQEFSAVTAACMLVSKHVFNMAGGFNEKDLAVAFNDVDLCLKIRELNYRIVWTPYAELYHLESITRGEDLTKGKKERFLKEIEYMNNTWGKGIINDPAYSPNLTLNAEDFTLAWPSRVEKLD